MAPLCTLCFTKTLVMNDFTRAQEFNRIAYIGVIGEAQDIIIGGACFLLCCNRVSTTF